MEYKTFIVYIAVLSIDLDDEMHPSKKAQIAYLKADKTPIKVLSRYADFANIFSSKLVVELLEYMGINNHTIELINDWQSLYDLIYSLGPVELKTLKMYIENNLANGFIKSFKFSARAPIFFDKKPDGSLQLCIDY